MDNTSSIKTPYWIEVIRHYLRKSYAQNGLTLPFLIGARMIVQPQLSMLSIEQFLHETVEYPVGTTVMRCAYIDEYVFAEMDTESQCYSSYYPRIGQLYFIEHSFGQNQHFSKLVDHFTSLYSDCIQKHCYSKDAGQWDFFSTIDQRRLGEVAKSFKTSAYDPDLL
jgi:hypothetical protein